MGQSGSAQIQSADASRLTELENLVNSLKQTINNLDVRLARLESTPVSTSPTGSSSSSSSTAALTTAVTNLDSRLNQTITNVNQLIQDVGNLIKVVNGIPKTGITPEIDTEFKIIYKNFDTLKPQYGYYLWEQDDLFKTDASTIPSRFVMGNLNLLNSQKTAWILKPKTHYIFYIAVNTWSNALQRQEYYLAYLNNPKNSIYDALGLNATLFFNSYGLPNITTQSGRPYITCPFYNNTNNDLECVIGIKQPTSSSVEYGFFKTSSWVLVLQI